MRVDPFGFCLEAPLAERANPYPSDLLCSDKPRLLEDLDVLFDAGQRHLERLSETGDRSVGSAKLIDDPAPCRVGQRRKREVKR